MITQLATTFGPEARDRSGDANDAGLPGAHAALETFYFALNQRDSAAMHAVWAPHPLAQLNNPVGGIVRGGKDAAALYDRIFSGPVTLQVSFGDIVEYVGDDHAVFAGRESGHYRVHGGDPVPLLIRTSRYFRYADGRWRQWHHHGSIDDAAALADYQGALRSSR